MERRIERGREKERERNRKRKVDSEREKDREKGKIKRGRKKKYRTYPVMMRKRGTWLTNVEDAKAAHDITLQH